MSRNDVTHCKKCGDRIWWEESAVRSCWVSTMNGSWCVNETSHQPEEPEQLTFPIPEDAEVVTAELLIVGYVRANGTNGYSVHARGGVPMTTFLGMTIVAQDEIKEWRSE